jgi:hypothetical protein
MMLLAGGALVSWPQQDWITRENFDRFREGLSMAKVEAVVAVIGECHAEAEAPRPPRTSA